MTFDTRLPDDHFLLRLIDEELRREPLGRAMRTRFPPEPNGYLHIGSVYAIYTNYAIAKAHGGAFHLRFDDTNPLKEDIRYVHAIIEDMKWLGFDPGEHIYYGSDYSEHIYNAALRLIRAGKAYVCDLTPEEMTAYRGTLTEPGRNSPYRSRTVEDNLRLFADMRQGRFPTTSKVLRAKIDMASPNINLRDPVLYRIIHAEHYRTGSEWPIYPMYDFAHPIQDALEGIAYSLCSIEFKDHRPLYEWVLRELAMPDPPRQREFGRLSIAGAVTSKRWLRQLVEGGYVDGWDDPRLPTVRGLRRRGYTPSSIRRFIEGVGGIRAQSVAHISMLDQVVRQELKASTVGLMAVLRPLKVVLINYPADQTELLTLENNADNRALGQRETPFSRTLFIDRDDFMEHPPKGYHRLCPHGEVRLKGAYYIRCEEVVKDPETGEVTELRCTYDPLTRSGSGFAGRKVKGTIHWVAAEQAVKAEVRLYEPLLLEQARLPGDGEDWSAALNPDSLAVCPDSLIEPAVTGLAGVAPEGRLQFIRHGYYCMDAGAAGEGKLVFHRIAPLKDSWNKRGPD